jgi:hypothetical protein
MWRVGHVAGGTCGGWNVRIGTFQTWRMLGGSVAFTVMERCSLGVEWWDGLGGGGGRGGGRSWEMSD